MEFKRPSSGIEEAIGLKRIIYFIFLSLFLPEAILGQQIGVPTGNWRVHLPYQSAFELTETPQELVVIAEQGTFFLNKADASIKRISKIDGFSATKMSVAKYNQETETLLIAYQDGNIDLVRNNQITNIDFIANSNTIQGVKQFNHIHFIDDDAYLSTSFGLIVVNLEKQEIRESYTNIGPSGSIIDIKASTHLGDSIYIATEVGIYAAKLSPGVILGQFTNWNLLGPAKGANHIAAYNNRLYADPDTNFSVFNLGSWQDIENDGRDTLNSLEVNYGKLIAAQTGKITIFNTTGIERDAKVNQVDKSILDETGQLWFVVRGFGLIKKDINQETQLLPNGPNGPTSFNMIAIENDIWVMGGGHNRGFDPLFDNVGYYRFTQGLWQNRASNSIANDMRDFTHPAYNKNTGELVIATQSTGLLSFNNNFEPQKSYNDQNSSLVKNPANGFLICNGVAFDKNDHLWVANSSSKDSSLVVRTKNEQWASLRFGARAGQIVVDENNYKWVVTPLDNGTGIIVYDDNETPLNPFDDRSIKLTSAEGNGNLINNNVVTIALDKDGEMWIGTTQGICVIRNTSRVFDEAGSFDADRLIITQGNNTDFLLGDEVINDLTVDGGNRKWVATRRGVFHITENGDSILRRFNSSNSPLLNDLVLSIGVVPNSGEVFFGTQDGIISYRGDATEPKESFKNIKVFPNPVRSGYEGLITIEGLKENTLVKITDLTGQLVSEGFSEGGTFTWDGKSLNGQRISTGIYLVLVADDKVEETDVAKILFMK